MSDTPCVDGCGQDAATIARLRERLARVEALVDTWDARDASYTDSVGLAPQVGLYEVVRELRAALTPQNHPRSAVDAPEAPGQHGRGEGGSGGRVEALARVLWDSPAWSKPWAELRLGQQEKMRATLEQAKHIVADPGPLLAALAETGVLREVTAPLKRNCRDEWTAVYDGNHTTEGRRYVTAWEDPDARP